LKPIQAKTSVIKPSPAQQVDPGPDWPSG
jgi:hypothetical protein